MDKSVQPEQGEKRIFKKFSLHLTSQTNLFYAIHHSFTLVASVLSLLLLILLLLL